MQDLDPSDICKKNILNPLKRIRVIIRTPTHGRTDGRTDRRTDKHGESSIPPLNFVAEGIIIWYTWRCLLMVILVYKMSACHVFQMVLPVTYSLFCYQNMKLTHTRPRDMARSRPPFWIFSFAAWKWVNMDGNWRNFDGNISSYV